MRAVPELLLKAAATWGDGVFGSVSYIRRLRMWRPVTK
ncbi:MULTISPECIES: DUF3455 domain-containing protein [unclassified Streptomyces]|nr:MULTISPECIES: DUF3455 domain-containing protein [unclassified Streptomyces]